MNLEKQAERFAKKAHKEQYRKDRKTPYIEHPEAVVALLKEIGIKDENIICAAWLHDVIEDCHIAKEEIEENFNKKIADLVETLTKGRSKKEYFKRIKNANYEAKIIKLADVTHNTSTLNRIPKKDKIRLMKKYKKGYLNLAKEVEPRFYIKILSNLINSSERN